MSFVNDLMGQDKRFGNNPEATSIQDNFFFSGREEGVDQHEIAPSQTTSNKS
jgi:hypothetical protein